ncbi:MAG: hypothetical protein JXA20_02980 [Spirochaetes bacterium]|nr:hypothetical protein [Spirochaetota bacterium]
MTGESLLFALVPLGMTLLAYLLTMAGFTWEYRKARAYIDELFGAGH